MRKLYYWTLTSSSLFFLHIITLSPTVAPLFMKLENVLGDIERTSVSLNNFIGIRDCVITADFLNVN